jgi:hypothetical protein
MTSSNIEYDNQFMEVETPHWRSFATSANFNLEHNHSVCNAITISLFIHSSQIGVNKITKILNAIASFLAMTSSLNV